MGQGPSIPTVGRRSSIRSSWRSPFTARRSRTHQEPLSATYNFVDSDLKMEQLNINLATEEELMTLPGISRSVAQGIVEYRQAIGRFNKVEDLALVSGIGAHKLDLIRPEICVSRKKNSSSPSSRAQSFDSLPSNGSGNAKTQISAVDGNTGSVAVPPSPIVSNSKSAPVDINTASVFELMGVRGLNQELAANIVAHRDRRGPFRSVDDLARVKGLGLMLLNSMRSHLCVKIPPDNFASNGLRNTITPSGIGRNNAWKVPKGKKGYNSSCDNHRLGHRKTSSAPIKYSGSFTLANGLDSSALPVMNGAAITSDCDELLNKDLEHHENGDPLWDLFELLSLHSERPIVEEIDDMKSEIKGSGVILRVASWNLDNFSADKAENPGVREVICRTILENRFTVVAVQEVLEEAAMKKVCDEMNQPILRRVAEWKHNSRAWKYAVFRPSKKSAMSLGFFYDSGRKVELIETSESYHLEKARSRSVPPIEAVMAVFKVQLSTFSVLNVYCNPCGEIRNGSKSHSKCGYISEHDLALQHQLKFKESQSEVSCPLVILGDFSGILVKDGKALLQNIGIGFCNVAPIGTVTNIEDANGNLRPSRQFHDNIFLGPVANQCYTGQWGVVRRGLCHLAIPKGWAWGGPVSSHCPLWCRMVLEQKEKDVSANNAIATVPDGKSNKTEEKAVMK
ncbi:endonuclease/exonuclease/phosphatase family domain-containing protein 1-like isoform X2 [Ischnura elegans]|uniref:endonuclease/exonuclease/phosphatase family domain-containing protein 1-like isoform X2 n=1 Tax=Ischnura elegans TaxID=197161 RepID=UPI001ED86A96|nr:endonuclease/exonuclease/phosphatase family domain-containing protein 1-like isoform X2 [Ischnura elegans]